MSSIQEINIGFFNIYYSIDSVPISAWSELESIKNGTYAKLINEVRFCFDKNREQYGILKRKLPAVTFSGVFQGPRKINHLVSYSNLIVLDIDHLENGYLENKKYELFEDKYAVAVWKSPSGHGLKLLVNVSSSKELHKPAFDVLINYYQNKFAVDFDLSGSDITRLCFSSFDEALLMKDSLTPFDFAEEANNELLDLSKTKNRLPEYFTNTLDEKILYTLLHDEKGRNRKADKEIIEKIILYLNDKNISITNTYQAWYKVALAIANTFTIEPGLGYYLALSRLDGRHHDEQGSIDMLEYCYRNRRPGAVSISTIIYFAMQKGFRPD